MKFGILVLCILLAIEICTTNFNINLTTSQFVIVKEANTLIGSSTKAFPKEAFINFILFGRSDVPFKYYDFISTYGYKTNMLAPSNLVIGNDGKLGGIAIDNISVAIPIINGKVTKVPSSSLKKYFSKGFTILANYPTGFVDDKTFYLLNVTINNNSICSNATADIYYANTTSTIFIDNNQLYYNISLMPFNMTAVLFGHLTGYDSKEEKGNFTVTCGLFNGTFLFTDPSAPNQVTFAYKILLRSSSSGTVIVNAQNKKINYTFTNEI